MNIWLLTEVELGIEHEVLNRWAETYETKELALAAMTRQIQGKIAFHDVHSLGNIEVEHQDETGARLSTAVGEVWVFKLDEFPTTSMAE